jgi:hypothetical protein
VTPVLVRASVRARLLGLPLLKLNADVALIPAEVARPTAVVAADGTLTDAAELLAHASRTLDAAKA